MAKGKTEVYLDHLIKRESLRYRRPVESFSGSSEETRTRLQLKDLIANSSNRQYLRKPDFQRATWSWTAEDCVSLLDSVVQRQVVPSIIMWQNRESGLDYILDGGHRVSVVMAWLNDDWGEDVAKNIPDPEIRQQIIEAAQRVKALVATQIGTIEQYKDAEKQIQQLVDDDKSPKSHLDNRTYNRGRLYQDLLKGDISFNILWVVGTYEIAEQSFLKINKSGKQLSDWEKLLIENRNSSFARCVMAISSGTSAKYYFPSGGSLTPELQGVAEEIQQTVDDLQHIILKPSYSTPIRTLQQPLLVAPQDKIPAYIAELLTVMEHYKGTSADTTELMQRNSDNPSESELVKDSSLILRNAMKILSHLVGGSNHSMQIIPLVYFYSPRGQHIRSLLYGFIYWMFQGDDSTIFERKIIFSAYRREFEYILIQDKQEIISRIGRKIGSGTEVTGQTAHYFNSLLELLIKYSGDIESEDFLQEYGQMLAGISGKQTKKVEVKDVKSRLFTPTQRSQIRIQAFFESAIKDEVTGGMIDPQAELHFDHIVKWSDGGKTALNNARLLVPFTNINRDKIEAYQQNNNILRLPMFRNVDDPNAPYQLRLLDDSMFDD